MKHLLKNTFAILDPAERKRIGLLLLLDIVISIADIASLALLLVIINFYTQPITANPFPLLPASFFDRHSLFPITAFLLLFSAKNLAGYLVYRAQSRFIGQVASRISSNNLQHYQEGPYQDYIQVDSAVQIRKISHSPIDFCQHIVGGIQQIITQSVLILLTIIAIVLFNAQLFLLLFILLLPPVIAVFYVIKKRLRSVRKYARASFDKALQHLQEALSGFVESNIYNKNREFLQRYITWQRTFNQYVSDMLIVQGIPNRMIEIFALLGLFILIAIHQWSGNTDNTAIITIGAFMAAAYKIIPGIVRILNASGQIGSYQYTIPELLAAQQAPGTKEPVAVSLPVQSIRFLDVSFQYDGRTILNKLNFSVEKGDFLGIAGQSGKGKTTILNLLLGFLTPHEGEIRINQQPANAQDRQLYWPSVSYVKQQSFLLHDTLLYNITLTAKGYNEKKLAEVICMAGLTSLIASFPEGLRQQIAENGKNISGGQRQRIAIARALYKEADLLLLDEPFNELDEAAETFLLEHLRQLSQNGKLVIFITHHQKSLSFCNKIISLDQEK